MEKKKKKKASDRLKGIQSVREVKEILQRNGCDVEGPGYALRFFGNKKEKMMGEKPKPVLVHSDYFGCFDLISYRPDMGYVFHQVSILEEKSKKVHDLMEANKPGWIWGRFYEGVRVAYRMFSVRDMEVIEREGVIFVTQPKQKGFSLRSDRELEIKLF